jgi:hypothetical protein
MWKNIVQPDRSQMTKWRMFIACWISKAKNTHLEYAIIIAFPLPKLLHECASMLRYIYIVPFVSLLVKSTCPHAKEI